MPTVQLGRRTIAKLPAVVKPTIYYDAALKGFGLRVLPKGEARWLIEYRPGAGGRGVAKKRIVIGSLGKLDPDEAREKAKTMLASVQLGQDPARERTEARKGATTRELLSVSVQELTFLRSEGPNPMRRFTTNMEKYNDFSFFTGTDVAQKCLHGATIDLNFNSWTDSQPIWISIFDRNAKPGLPGTSIS